MRGLDHCLVLIAPDQLDRTVRGFLPDDLGAKAPCRLLVAAHNIKESTIGITDIESGDLRPQPELCEEIGFELFGSIESDQIRGKQILTGLRHRLGGNEVILGGLDGAQHRFLSTVPC